MKTPYGTTSSDGRTLDIKNATLIFWPTNIVRQMWTQKAMPIGSATYALSYYETTILGVCIEATIDVVDGPTMGGISLISTLHSFAARTSDASSSEIE